MKIKNLITVTFLSAVLVACGGTPAQKPDTKSSVGNTTAASTTSSIKDQAIKDGFAVSEVQGSDVVERTKKIDLKNDTVYFDYDSASLTPESMMLLNKQLQFILSNNDLKIILEGHTDERGTREYNLALGERRATMVKKYMIGKGVKASRIRVVSFGKERPIAELDGKQKTIWSKNRRVQTILM